jgi:hypothetical protein
MQSYDENDRIVQAQMIDAIREGRVQDAKDLSQQLSPAKAKSLADQIASAMRTAAKKGAVKHVIANLPNQGQEVEINGLKFKVSYVNNKRGDVHMKLMGIEEPDAPAEEDTKEESVNEI